MTVISILQASSDRCIHNIISTKMLIGIGTRLLDRYSCLTVISVDCYKRVPLYS